MRRVLLVITLLWVACWGYAQDAEACRYEVLRWSKDQGCRFVSFQEAGGMMVTETDQTDDDKNRLWNFITLDSSLYELRSDLIPLPGKMKLFDAKSDARWAAFLFVNDRTRSDTIPFMVVTYDRRAKQFSTFSDHLVERSIPHSMALMDGVMMLSVNHKDGKGYLLRCDLERHQFQTIRPSFEDDFVLFQFSVDEKERVFVLAVREYVEKRYKATSFLVYSTSGAVVERHRFENSENAGLGRMCFGFDRAHQLTVIATLERENNKKVKVEGVTEDFNRTAVGVTWIQFASGGMQTRTYLFKDIPDIDKALTASDRLRVREELLKMQRGKKKEQGEIAFQFLTPRMVSFGGNWVFAAEAFQPVYHTETRMDYGFYGTYPRYYTVFDGYDFFSEILLAFDEEGTLKWHRSLRFENDLTEEMKPHAAELVSHDELVVVSPSHQVLRYEVFDLEGEALLDQESFKMDFLNKADLFEDEYEAWVEPWFGDRFLIQGCQILQNGLLGTPRRTVFYLQKVKYE